MIAESFARNVPIGQYFWRKGWPGQWFHDGDGAISILPPHFHPFDFAEEVVLAYEYEIDLPIAEKLRIIEWTGNPNPHF